MKHVRLIIVAAALVALAATHSVADTPAADPVQAELAMLRSAVKRQAEELASLRAENQSLTRQLDECRSKLPAANAQPTSGPTSMPAAKSPYLVPKLRHGDLEIGIMSADVGWVPLDNTITGIRGVSADQLLSILLVVSNKSDSRKIDYRTWGDEPLRLEYGFAGLTDNLANVYKRISFSGGDMPACRTSHESIYPGKVIGDVLIFEPPVAKATTLTLTLPLSNIGGSGELKVNIPVSSITRR